MYIFALFCRTHKNIRRELPLSSLVIPSCMSSESTILHSQGLRRERKPPPPSPHVFGNFKELLRKRSFQPHHFESLLSLHPHHPPPHTHTHTHTHTHFQNSSAGPVSIEDRRRRCTKLCSYLSTYVAEVWRNLRSQENILLLSKLPIPIMRR